MEEELSVEDMKKMMKKVSKDSPAYDRLWGIIREIEDLIENREHLERMINEEETQGRDVAVGRK